MNANNTMDQSETSDKSREAETAPKEQEVVIARTETKAVGCLKIIVAAVLIASTVLVASTTYSYLSQSEHNKFTTQFKVDGAKIFDEIGTSMDKTFGLMDSAAVLFASHARATNQSWPFVTVPDFALRMAKILPLTNSIILTMLPIVSSQERKEWEAYSISNDFWVDEGMSVQETWKWYNGPVMYSGGRNYKAVFNDFGDLPSDHSQDMIPVWQTFPVLPNSSYTYNYDWASTSLFQAYDVSIQRYKTSVSKPYMVPTPGDEVEELETALWADFFRNYLPVDEEPVEPVSDLTFPIVDKVNSVQIDGSDGEYKPVGLITVTLYWRSMIRHILPEESNGIHIVFDNACSSDSFTYQIDGPKATYLGVGDKHESKYDHLLMEKKLSELSQLTEHESMYTGAPLDEIYCPFTLRLYPSQDMESRIKTSHPLMLSVAAALIFVFTSLVFYTYDYAVEKRQKTVMQTAVRSSAIVSSLFPTTVRDRLYPDAPEEATKGGSTAKRFGTGKGLFSATNVANSTDFQPNSDTAGPPIATLYNDTTVLFADVVGFTEWSSTRQPADVFTLLETIYAAFDAIAKQHGVFKVETIGDCYLAVVGLPTPRKTHAVIMARFASECRSKMQSLVVDLERTLGLGTAHLGLRIGLNSGQTTAGVLRGEKSRFQVFGDTVNTAARMESNGERNRIHVSQSTAELIVAEGKSHWLMRREDQIIAKGKGAMTTFWCEPHGGHEQVSTVSVEEPSEDDTETYYA